MNASYSDKLPRRFESVQKCQHLDRNGNRCGYPARYEATVHGDPEIDNGWYAVLLCGSHIRTDDKAVLKLRDGGPAGGGKER